MRVRPYAGVGPRFGARVFVASSAVIVGDVELSDDVSVWYGAVVRGDVGPIRIGARTSIQDGAVIHPDSPALPVTVEEDVTVGHAAVLHGCTVGRGALVGIGAAVLDGAVVGPGAVVAAGAVVPPGMEVPADSLVTGVPASVKRRATPDDVARSRRAVMSYLELKARYMAGDDESEVADPDEWERVR